MSGSIMGLGINRGRLTYRPKSEVGGGAIARFRSQSQLIPTIPRAEKPVIRSTPQMEELRELGKKTPKLMVAWESLLAVPPQTKKGGASHELSSNGVWCLSDPKASKPEIGEKIIKRMVNQAVKFIEAWKRVA